MQCDYCGQEILGHPIAVELEADEISPDVDLQAGDLYFCSTECHHAYMEEAGVSLEKDRDEDLIDEEEFSFSDRMHYAL